MGDKKKAATIGDKKLAKKAVSSSSAGFWGDDVDVPGAGGSTSSTDYYGVDSKARKALTIGEKKRAVEKMPYDGKKQILPQYPGAPYNANQFQFGDSAEDVDIQEVMRGLTRPALRRLARRGGVKWISAGIYFEARTAMHSWLSAVLRDVDVYFNFGKRSTVRPTDVVQALKRQGRSIYGYGA